MSLPSAGASRRAVLAIGAAFAGCAVTPALAAPSGAEAFVARIYSHYRGTTETAPGVKIDTPAELRRYFEPSLADIIIADEAAADSRHDVPTLDGDPFIDAQDWEITDISWTVTPHGALHADADVHFKNFKEPHHVTLQLVQLKIGWRIHDIVYYGDDQGTLRGLYKKK